MTGEWLLEMARWKEICTMTLPEAERLDVSISVGTSTLIDGCTMPAGSFPLPGVSLAAATLV